MTKAYKCKSPFTFGMIMVQTMKGIALTKASFHLPVLPHIMPKAEKRNPESPMVEPSTYIGRKLAATATAKDSTTEILFLMLQSTIILMARWKRLA